MGGWGKYPWPAGVLCAFCATLAATVGMGGCQTPSKRSGDDGALPRVEHTASRDGVPIYYELFKLGEQAVVLVHGWSMDRSYWSEQVRELRDRYTVVTIDLGGHGQSGRGREHWSMESFGADVVAVIAALDLKDVILVGHSMGGAVCIEASRLMPDRVTALVGVDTYQDLERRWTPAQIDTLLQPFRNDFVTTTEAFVRSIFGPAADSELVALVASDLAAAPPEIALSAFESLFAYAAPERLQGMRKPIRCINADTYPSDTAAGRRTVESFAVRIIPGVGHFPHMEAPKAFNALLLETLQEFWPDPHS
jgi:pimeloyl-ACP methyl ester carboxylesterase